MWRTVEAALQWVAGIPAVLEFIILLGAAIGAFLAIKRYVWTPIRAHFNRVNAGMDTLLGYPAVKDPGSGREIQPATPPLAARVYDLENTNQEIAHALTSIAQTQRSVLDLQAAWEEREKTGEQIIEEWTAWRVTHEEAAELREQRIAEWSDWRADIEKRLEELRRHGR